MEFTGERVIPGQGDIDLLNEHWARYRFAQQFSAGRQVLDAACGTGYGSALLAENASAVFGVDISREAVAFAQEHFRSPKIHFAQSDCLALPFATGQFDFIAAFEILEHVKSTEAFLCELHRVLHPAGQLILSTPNRLYYTEERGEENPFHEREFTYAELDEALRAFFPHRAILTENHVPALLIAENDMRPTGEQPLRPVVRDERKAATADEEQKGAHFFLAICSAQPLDPVSPLLYMPAQGNILREREIHIRSLSAELARITGILWDRTRELEERTQWARELDKRLSEKDSYLARLQSDYEGKIKWALQLEEELNEARAKLHALQADYDQKIQWALSLNQEVAETRATLQKLQKEFEERTAWALRLDSQLDLLHRLRWYRMGRRFGWIPDENPQPDTPNAGES